MTQKEKQGIVALIVLLFLVISWIGVSASIFLIELSRALFWVDLILGALFFIIAAFFIIKGIDEGNDRYFTIAIMCLALLIFSGFLLGGFYEGGYSDEALEEFASLHEQKEELELMIDIIAFKGKKTSRKLVEEAFVELCEDPNFPCEGKENVSKNLLDLYGNKGSADSIAAFLWIR